MIGFSTGRVKVGKSTSPRQRIGHQVTAARGLGVDVTDIWLSIYHHGYSENERIILNKLGALGSEYINVPYDEAINVTESVVERNTGEYSF